MHLQPHVLRTQPGQIHLFGRDRLGARGIELARSRGLDPFTQRLLHQAPLTRTKTYPDLLGPPDRLFPDLGRVLLLQYLLHYFSSFQSRC